MDWNKSSNEILKYVGGKDNVTDLTNCVTRLRFNVKDREKVNEGAMNKVEGVVSSQWIGEQYQVIIGGAVETPYKKLIEMTGLEEKAPVALDADRKQRGSAFDRVIDTLSGTFTPLLPAIVGCAFILAILALLKVFNLIDAESQTYQILSFVGNTIFYFLPVFLAVSAGRKFNMNPWVAGVIGAMLIHPNFIAMVAAGEPIKLFGSLPVTGVSYASSVIPAVLAVWIASNVEKWVDKILPDSLKFSFKSFIVIMIMIPVAFCIVGPLGTWVGKIFALGLNWLTTNIPWAIPLVFGAFAQVIILTGMHVVVTIPLVMAALSTYGFDTIGPGFLVSNIASAAAASAVLVLAKNKEYRGIAVPAVITSWIGTQEPVLYGIHLKLKKPFLALIIGGGIGGLIAGLTGVKRIVFSGTSLLTLPIFIDPNNNMNIVWTIISIVVAGIVSFALSYVMCKNDKQVMAEIQ